MNKEPQDRARVLELDTDIVPLTPFEPSSHHSVVSSKFNAEYV